MAVHRLDSCIPHFFGEQPQGFPTYHFRQGYDGARLPVPEKVAHRRDKLQTLRLSDSAKQVLQTLGAPDHVRQHSYRDSKIYRWKEDWEYD